MYTFLEAVRMPKRIAGLSLLLVLTGFLAGSAENPAFRCLALNIYWEARLEPVEGKWAVAYVTVARAMAARSSEVDKKKWGGPNICNTVFKSGIDKSTNRRVAQFSWILFVDPSREPVDVKNYQLAELIARETMRNPDAPLKYVPGIRHARYYLNPRATSPANYCRFQREFIAVNEGLPVGRHFFYREPTLEEIRDRRKNPVRCVPFGR